MINNTHFLLLLFQVGHIIFGTHKLRLFHNCVVFVWRKLSTRPFQRFLAQIRKQSWLWRRIWIWLNTWSHFSLSKELLKDGVAKLKTLCLPFSNSVLTRKWVQKLSSAFISATSISPRRVSSSSLDLFIEIPGRLFLCCRNAQNPENTSQQILQLKAFFSQYLMFPGHEVIQVWRRRCWKVWLLTAINCSIRRPFLGRVNLSFVVCVSQFLHVTFSLRWGKAFL